MVDLVSQLIHTRQTEGMGSLPMSRPQASPGMGFKTHQIARLVGAICMIHTLHEWVLQAS